MNRLLNMGVEPFLVASAVNVIQAQRLARKIHPDCKVPEDCDPQAIADLGMDLEKAKTIQCYKGEGCHICSETGYKGRVALSEVMYMYDEIKEFILNGASAAEIKDEAIRLGMLTLRQAGILRLAEGSTTLEEVLRSTAAD